MPDIPVPPADRPETLRREDGATIAYHRTRGKSPGIMFLTGFKSDMTGGKALALEAMCKKRGNAFLRFDYTGHGASSGRFIDGTIGAWKDDAVFALDRLTEGPQVLVGSSMGGWLMLLAALARPQRIAGLVGIAPAPDFTEDLIWDRFTEEQRRELADNGQVMIPNDYDMEPYAIAKGLIEDGRDHLLLREAIPLSCPVRLIQGLADPDVPWQTSLRIQERLLSEDVEIAFVKGAGHRLSEPLDLDRMCRTVAALLDRLEADL